MYIQGERRESFKEINSVYIQNDLTLGHTSQALNLNNSYSFFNVGLTHCFFLLRIVSILGKKFDNIY